MKHPFKNPAFGHTTVSCVSLRSSWGSSLLVALCLLGCGDLRLPAGTGVGTGGTELSPVTLTQAPNDEPPVVQDTETGALVRPALSGYSEAAVSVKTITYSGLSN